MRKVQSLAALFKASAIVGIEDFRAFYTWRSWILGWLMRVIFQVLFFALIGRLLGSTHEVRFLLVGGAAAIAVLESLTIVLFTAFDRAMGILTMLISSPADYYLVMIARNINCIVTGATTATIGLFACSFIVDLPLSYPRALLVIPIILLGSTTTYLFGALICAVIIKFAGGRWLILNLSYMAIAVLAGFYVPTSFWPAPFAVIAQVLPFSHALRAIRGTLSGAAPGSVLAQCGLELLVGVCWFLAGRAALRLSVALARRDGSIDLSVA
jgi:ABC-2 type transport system permease protein